MVMIHTLFLASFFFGVFRRHWPVLVIAATILLKTLIHGVIVAQPRYFMPAIALELLAIALWIDDVLNSQELAQSVAITLGAVIVIFLLAIVSLKAQAYVLTHDEIVHRVSRSSKAEKALPIHRIIRVACAPGGVPRERMKWRRQSLTPVEGRAFIQRGYDRCIPG
jgi:hypothetical protein